MRQKRIVLYFALVATLGGSLFGQTITPSTAPVTPPAPQTPAPQPPAPQPPAPQPPAPQPQLPKPLTQSDKDEIKKFFNDALVTGQAFPFKTTCSATTGSCAPPAVFVSAADISAIMINEFPSNAGPLTVTLDAGEVDSKTGRPILISRKYTSTPDFIVITVHKARGFSKTYSPMRGSGGGVLDYLSTETDRIYDNDRVIGFVTLGGAENLPIQLDLNGQSKTIMAQLSYQRWFVDMGGFITFASTADQELA